MPRPKATPAIQVQHSLSPEQAQKLRELANGHARAQVALLSWAGGGNPIDAPVIKAEALLAEAQLSAFIARLVEVGK